MGAATANGPTKAAILMVLLGEETSAKILQHCDEADVLAIGKEVAGLREIGPAIAAEVLEEYRERILAHRETSAGGPEAARRKLSRTLSPTRAPLVDGANGKESRSRSQKEAQPLEPSADQDAGPSPFAALDNVKDLDLAQTLELEHPQTAALVLLHLDPARAAGVLSGMNEETQAGVTARLARLCAIPSEVTNEVSEGLAARFASVVRENVEERDGVGKAAEMLKRMDRSKSRAILAKLETVDAEYAEKLRSRVYTFEMLLMLTDRGIQEILKGIDTKQLGFALKGSETEVGVKFFKNMSIRAAELVKDEMEFLGVPRVKDVEAAQQDIMDKALRLEEEGVITFEVPAGESGAA